MHVGHREFSRLQDLRQALDDHPTLQWQARRRTLKGPLAPRREAVLAPRQRNARVISANTHGQGVDPGGGFLHQNQIRAMMCD